MSTKHTSGQLKLEVTDSETSITLYAPGGKYVAQVNEDTVSWYDKGVKDNEKVTEQDRANAERLRDCWNNCEGINPEAVPEMLAALKRVLEHVEPCNCTEEDWLENDECEHAPERERLSAGVDSALPQIRAAIAKAEGRS